MARVLMEQTMQLHAFIVTHATSAMQLAKPKKTACASTTIQCSSAWVQEMAMKKAG